MRLLELFCGGKSVSKAVGHLFHEVVSLDVQPQTAPTICCDVLQWDYRFFQRGHFEVVWASPPCTEYSRLKNSTAHLSPRDLITANRISRRTLEIIRWFAPLVWYVENPQTGLLKRQRHMAGLPFFDVDYCAYAVTGFRKRTRVWTNKHPATFTPKLCAGAECPSMANGIHRAGLGGGYGGRYASNMPSERGNVIPVRLVTDLFAHNEITMAAELHRRGQLLSLPHELV